MSVPPRIILSASTIDNNKQNGQAPDDNAAQNVFRSSQNLGSSSRSNPSSRSNSLSGSIESRKRSTSFGEDAIINNRLSIFTNTSLNLFNNAIDDNESMDSQSIQDLNGSLFINSDDDNDNVDPLDILESALNGAWMPSANETEKMEKPSEFHLNNPTIISTLGMKTILNIIISIHLLAIYP